MLRALPLLLLTAATAWAQVPAGLDTLSRAGAPAAEEGEPIRLPVPAAPAAEGGLERPVRYTARDSLRIVLAPRDAEGGPGDVVSLFGQVATDYEGSTITAGRVDYEAANQALRARAVDGDTSSVPRFNGEEGAFTGEQFVYNLRTQRGRVTSARTSIQEGYLLGGVIKQQDAHVVFAQDAAYTTCTLDHPHYALEAGRIKVVDGERVYTGPVRLTLLGIPMPLVLPFGYFPAAEGRRSGPLALNYGRDTNYGLFLDNIGWYWAISDYLDAQVAGKLGSAGSFLFSGATRYNRRYRYSGQVRLRAGRLRQGESTDPGFAPRIPLGLAWNHNQTLSPTQRLTASVNLETESQRQTAEDVSSQIRSVTNSSVTYAQQWPDGGRSLTVSGQASQDFAQNTTTAQLPQVAFSQQRVFPFRSGRDDKWYEKVAVSYTANAQNAFSYRALGDTTVSVFQALTSPTAFRQGACPDADGDGAPDAGCTLSQFDYQVVQAVPVTASFSVPRFNLNLTPSLNYTETWTDDSVALTYDPVLRRPVESRVPGFTAVRQAAASVTASTEFYGTFPVRIGSLDGVRHTVAPQLSFNYQPDYAAFGFVREVQADSAGTVRRYAINPTIPITETRALRVGIENAFVARTVRTDSTGAEQRTTRQVLAVSLTGGYNFADPLRPIADPSASFTTQAFGFNASGNAQFSAYAQGTEPGDSPLTYFDVTGRPLQLRSATLRVDRSFQSGQRAGPADVRPVAGRPVALPDYNPGLDAPRSAAVGFIDYSAPWAFSAGFSLATTAGALGGPARTEATLDVNQFTARLTPNWRVTGSTGFDFKRVEVTQTRVGLVRDLHCWELAVNWQPIGQTKLFAVSLYVKGGFLRDLLRLDIPNSTVRSQSLTRGLGGFGGGF